jgi:hypothetical protein
MYIIGIIRISYMSMVLDILVNCPLASKVGDQPPIHEGNPPPTRPWEEGNNKGHTDHGTQSGDVTGTIE